MKLISGAVVEGWKWGVNGPSDEEWTHLVTHYSVEFSPDGRLWTVVKDENGLPRVSTKLTLSYGRNFQSINDFPFGQKWRPTLVVLQLNVPM